MASQHPKKKFPKSIQAARAVARAFNTLDVSHLHGALSDKALVDGDHPLNRAEGTDATLSHVEMMINKIGALHRPFFAEVGRLEYAPKKYFSGVLIEIDDTAFMFLAVHTNKQGLIDVIYVHQHEPYPSDAEVNGDRPGFSLAKYESDKTCLWAMRKETAKKLSSGARPHFVAVLDESQDPQRMLLVLDELTRAFDGSTCELMFASKYYVSNVNALGDQLSYQHPGDLAVDEMGSVGFPALGVKLGDEYIRPGYRSWNPDAVTSDLLRMGISTSSQFKEQVISVN
jgi:hypothetical protein